MMQQGEPLLKHRQSYVEYDYHTALARACGGLTSNGQMSVLNRINVKTKFNLLSDTHNA